MFLRDGEIFGRLREKLTSNNGMKLVSVFIAILIWLLVANTNDPVISKKYSDIPVKIINDNVLTDKGYAYDVIEGDRVTVTVMGKKSIVSGLAASDFQAVADFTKLSKVDAIPIDITVARYSDQLELSLGNVNTMKIKEEKTVSTSVPVNVEVSGDMAEGLALGKVTGTPNLVKVTGPESLVSTVKEIRADVRVNKPTEKITTTVKPVLYDNEGHVVDSNQIEMNTSEINVSIEVWKTKSVKISIETAGEPAAGYRLVSFDYEPKKITVAAPDDELRNLNTLKLPSVDLDGLTEDYEADIDINELLSQENVVVVGETTDVKVKATIEEVVTRTLNFTQEDITVKGAGSRTVIFDNDNKYFMTIEGVQSRINTVRISDYAPWINVEGLEEGEHELTIHVKEVEGTVVEKTAKVKVVIE